MGRNYENIEVYRLAYSFVLEVYKIIKLYPQSEENNIASQLRRSSVSIVLNIAEGSAKASRKEFVHFLNTAFASAKEVEVLLKLSRDLGFLEQELYNKMYKLLDELNAKLYMFIRNVESKITGQKRTFFQKFENKD
ncbi:four helix bundle protein [Candidatus Woesearchaeota archaeon CG10_big_fil_rev_8_21_14_0_10_36_11]|nr:MAG: four helix bundle protein [Candidatus Woesearchaeota archaeon CG10_big_fil_rev_8_21_14_0_10_36_11]